MTQTAGLDPEIKSKVCFDCKMFDVAFWVANNDGGLPPHDIFPVASPEHPHSLVGDLFSSPCLVANPLNALKVSDLYPKDQCSDPQPQT